MSAHSVDSDILIATSIYFIRVEKLWFGKQKPKLRAGRPEPLLRHPRASAELPRRHYSVQKDDWQAWF
jgi:hypothetical protein